MKLEKLAYECDQFSYFFKKNVIDNDKPFSGLCLNGKKPQKYSKAEMAKNSENLEKN